MLWGEVGRSGGFSWFFFSLTPAGNEQAHISTAVPACRRVNGRYGLSGHIRTYGGRPRPGGHPGPLPPRVRGRDHPHPQPRRLHRGLQRGRLRGDIQSGEGRAGVASERSTVAPQAIRPFLGRRAGRSGSHPDSGTAPRGRSPKRSGHRLRPRRMPGGLEPRPVGEGARTGRSDLRHRTGVAGVRGKVVAKILPPNETQIHAPVMVEEVVRYLSVQPGGRYVDCTVGGGGHSLAILEAAAPGGLLLGIDADENALEIARERLQPFADSTLLVHANFRDLAAVCAGAEFVPVHGVLFDLGVSSYQLGDEERGFSFQTDAPLDMRFGAGQAITATT